MKGTTEIPMTMDDLLRTSHKIHPTHFGLIRNIVDRLLKDGFAERYAEAFDFLGSAFFPAPADPIISGDTVAMHEDDDFPLAQNLKQVCYALESILRDAPEYWDHVINIAERYDVTAIGMFLRHEFEPEELVRAEEDYRGVWRDIRDFTGEKQIAACLAIPEPVLKGKSDKLRYLIREQGEYSPIILLTFGEDAAEVEEKYRETLQGIESICGDIAGLAEDALSALSEDLLYRYKSRLVDIAKNTRQKAAETFEALKLLDLDPDFVVAVSEKYEEATVQMLNLLGENITAFEECFGDLTQLAKELCNIVHSYRYIIQDDESGIPDVSLLLETVKSCDKKHKPGQKLALVQLNRDDDKYAFYNSMYTWQLKRFVHEFKLRITETQGRTNDLAEIESYAGFHGVDDNGNPLRPLYIVEIGAHSSAEGMRTVAEIPRRDGKKRDGKKNDYDVSRLQMADRGYKIRDIPLIARTLAGCIEQEGHAVLVGCSLDNAEQVGGDESRTFAAILRKSLAEQGRSDITVHAAKYDCTGHAYEMEGGRLTGVKFFPVIEIVR